ncbi:MAG: shikimate kinase [Candidatus Aenigmarchaeota archaeon]|nr:shikimate kinase [Candidatus Aenigmarchaeota archaeon]
MNTTLIGMAGVGKSYIGKKLADHLDYLFIDTDRLIEDKTQLKLQQIVDDKGDEHFIKIEEEIILGLNHTEDSIFSTGGSVVYSEKAMDFLKEKSVVVYLDDLFENIEKRLENASVRGIVGFKDNSIRVLFEERSALYEKYADFAVKLPEKADFKDVLVEIVEKIPLFEK